MMVVGINMSISLHSWLLEFFEVNETSDLREATLCFYAEYHLHSSPPVETIR